MPKIFYLCDTAAMLFEALSDPWLLFLIGQNNNNNNNNNAYLKKHTKTLLPKNNSI